MKKLSKDALLFNIAGYFVIGLLSLLCIMPFVIIITSSFTNEYNIITYGYRLIPKEFSLDGYMYAFKDPMAIARAYGVTIFVTVTGTLIGTFVTAMTAYVLQRKDFKWRNGFSFYFFFTTLFNGGLVPWYIMMVKYLNMKNSILALILPLLLNVFYILIMKGFIAGIPDAITESAKIDGANDFIIFVKLIYPLSLPAVATISLFTALNYWNDWYNTMLFISDTNMYTLQYFLYNLLTNAEALRNGLIKYVGANVEILPVESMKMAMTVVVTGPIILLYPFVQKYFVRGITIGAVKG